MRQGPPEPRDQDAPGGVLEATRSPVHPANRSFIIATAPRTGSSLLAEALSATGRAGTPNEFFDIVPANEQHWERRYAVPQTACYVDHIVQATRTANDMFGFKLHWHQIPALRRRLIEAMPATATPGPIQGPDNRPVYDLISRRFPGIRFIWLSRRNKVAQAISYYRAANTKVWRLWNDGRSPPAAMDTKLGYDRAAIEIFLRRVNAMDIGWRQFFAAHKIPALIVIYEDFAQTYEHTVRGVMNFLGQPSGDLIVPPPGLIRLADDESLEWERRFRAETPRPVNRVAATAAAASAARAAADAAAMLALPRPAESTTSRPAAATPTRPAIPAGAATGDRTLMTPAGMIPAGTSGAPAGSIAATATPKPVPTAREAARKRVAQVPKVAKSAEPSLPLIAYDVESPLKTNLVPGQPTRAWMDATPKRFAYRCLPMIIANQWGWMIETHHRVEAVWDGSGQASGLVVTSGNGQPSTAASSHFGCGVLTFHVGFLIRTPPGYNLHVRGPANWPKDGISALEGVIESDWAESTFTMNWKMTRPNHRVVFEAGEPIAMISPVRRGELERFTAETRMLSANPELRTKYAEWSASRSKFNADLRTTDSEARKQGWQKDYVRGRSVSGDQAPEHQTSVVLTPFRDRRRDG
jgi:LPS sulfotransferase NodH